MLRSFVIQFITFFFDPNHHREMFRVRKYFWHQEHLKNLHLVYAKNPQRRQSINLTQTYVYIYIYDRHTIKTKI